MTKKNGQKGKKPEKTARRQDQEAFVTLFNEANGNLSELCARLEQSYNTVYRRCYRMGLIKKQAVNHRMAGQVIAVVDQAAKKAEVRGRKKKGESKKVENLLAGSGADAGNKPRAEGFRDIERQVTVFDALEAGYHRINDLTLWLEKDLRDMKAKGKQVTGYHIDLVCRLVRESRATISEMHKIRQEQYTVRGTQLFMEAVVNVLMKKEPNVRRELYIELARLGAASSTTITDTGERSDTDGDTDVVSDAGPGEELPE